MEQVESSRDTGVTAASEDGVTSCNELPTGPTGLTGLAGLGEGLCEVLVSIARSIDSTSRPQSADTAECSTDDESRALSTNGSILCPALNRITNKHD